MLSKIFFSLAGICVFFVLFIKLFAFFFQNSTEGIIGKIVSLHQSTIVEINLALIILFIGIGVITLFFHRQFKKLSSIADDIETLDESEI